MLCYSDGHEVKNLSVDQLAMPEISHGSIQYELEGASLDLTKIQGASVCLVEWMYRAALPFSWLLLTMQCSFYKTILHWVSSITLVYSGQATKK